MIWLLKWLIFGHVHQWDTVVVKRLEEDGGNAVGTRYHLRCTKCGDVRKRDLI